ncbi:MAG TPA: hypothetical protein VJ973_05090 [Christiangramia sp.]|nr:hypothetical protein [Christiangramia sp.]
MKKLFLLFAVATMSLSIYSCRETTEEKSEEAVESMGEDMENAADEAGDELEEAGQDVENAAENAENEMEEEVEGTDDMNADDDM